MRYRFITRLAQALHRGFRQFVVEAGKTSKGTEKDDGDIDAQNKTLSGTGLTDEPCSGTNALRRERLREEQRFVAGQQEPEPEAQKGGLRP